MFTTAYSSLDCLHVINLASGLGMQSIEPTIWSEMQSDCCLPLSVRCPSGIVTEIFWGSLGLNGSINATAIPSGLQILDLRFNYGLTGTLPRTLHDGFQYFSVARNRLNGSLPTTLPASLTYFAVDGNDFTGEVPLFPSSLLVLALGHPDSSGNLLSGSVRLHQPERLFINEQLITDVEIQDASVITECDLSGNPLLGNPNIATLTMCDMTGLYSASSMHSKTSQPNPSKSIRIATISAIGRDERISLTIYFSDSTSSAIGLVFNTFNPRIFKLSISRILNIIFRVIIDVFVLVYIIKRTPFKREWKNANKQHTAATYLV